MTSTTEGAARRLFSRTRKPARHTDAIAHALSRHEFSVDMARGWQKAGLILIPYAAVVSIVLIVVLFRGPQYRYFPFDSRTGAIVEVKALSSPEMTDDAAGNWAITAVRQAFNFDHVHWSEQLQVASSNFTNPGWEALSAEMNANQLVDKVVKARAVLYAAATTAPVTTKRGTLPTGEFAWEFKFDMALTTYGASEKVSATWHVWVTAIRVPPSVNPAGIAITTIKARPA